jgi:hypothetical protein
MRTFITDYLLPALFGVGLALLFTYGAMAEGELMERSAANFGEG